MTTQSNPGPGEPRASGSAPRAPQRDYPGGVTLVRRRETRGEAGRTRSFAEIEAWLLDAAVAADDLLVLFQSFAWRLCDAGLPLDRATLHVGTLHPQLAGFAWIWSRLDRLCDEVQVSRGLMETDSFRLSPMYEVVEGGRRFHAFMSDRTLVARYPLLQTLAADGYREYLALPLNAGGYYNAATVATAHGFDAEEIVGLERLFRLFALHVERHIVQRIASNVLDTYLGSAAGAKVLTGSIERGTGEAIRAVIWVSDLRGFTDLSNRLSGPEVTVLLNAYFQCLVGAIEASGGQVLKFIGDGLLAVFPFEGDEEAGKAAEAALTAAEQSLTALEILNRAPPPVVAAISGWRPLRNGIALHEGEVFFGNVGSPGRLDFTVIGRAVNEAARVEALSKSLDRSLLITAPVAARLDRPLVALGAQPLRGLAESLEVFGL
ncbi:MAG: adenylate/guanylate cyclase domain-containing protein [Rhodospirillales bacterium]